MIFPLQLCLSIALPRSFSCWSHPNDSGLPVLGTRFLSSLTVGSHKADASSSTQHKRVTHTQHTSRAPHRRPCRGLEAHLVLVLTNMSAENKTALESLTTRATTKTNTHICFSSLALLLLGHERTASQRTPRNFLVFLFSTCCFVHILWKPFFFI